MAVVDSSGTAYVLSGSPLTFTARPEFRQLGSAILATQAPRFYLASNFAGVDTTSGIQVIGADGSAVQLTRIDPYIQNANGQRRTQLFQVRKSLLSVFHHYEGADSPMRQIFREEGQSLPPDRYSQFSTTVLLSEDT